MQPTVPDVTLYRVEISGWDSNEEFFVEKTDLEWSEETGKRVRLRHPLRDGSIVFVRLLQAVTPSRAYPIAYQVERLSKPENGGCQEFQLKQLHPRTQ